MEEGAPAKTPNPPYRAVCESLASITPGTLPSAVGTVRGSSDMMSRAVPRPLPASAEWPS